MKTRTAWTIIMFYVTILFSILYLKMEIICKPQPIYHAKVTKIENRDSLADMKCITLEIKYLTTLKDTLKVGNIVELK